jgi:hypothetical protein
VILHGLLVASLAVAIVTGLRIAAETPAHGWTGIFDFVLPKATVWAGHVNAAMLLIAVSIAYAVYVLRAGLVRRIRLDRVRLQGLLGRSAARWGTINVVLYWMFYSAMLMQLVTGVLLYLGQSSSSTVWLHWLGMWTIVGYAALHVTSQWKVGGTAQLLRIVRPSRLSPPPPPFDPADVLALLDERANPPLAPHVDQAKRRPAAPSASGTTQRHDPAAPPGRPSAPRQRGPVIQANPFVVASATAIVGVAFLMAIERQATDTLHIHRIGATDIPVIDGETSDPIWRKVAPIRIVTEQGGNFDGKGETTISIQAVHDGTWAYFLFIWDDPTRSLKQLPLRKSSDGWHLLHDGYETSDEHAYNEDKFSVLLTKLDAVLAGDLTFHAGATPAAGKPRTLSGRGLHYTTAEGVFADVWQWKATSTSPSQFMDDNHFGPPAAATSAQAEGMMPYRGGFAADPGTSNYQDNFMPRPPWDYGKTLVPRRLPKDLSASMAALGYIDLDPDHGESEGARWYMTEDESVPYSPELDRQIPEGAIIPGVVLSGQYSGDRADVRCGARWAAGRWSLEVVRRLEVQSPYDVAIARGTFMRVAAFDHAQIRHTRHVRPIRLEVE